MALTRVDIINKSFPKQMRGYASQEVDLFLQEVAEVVGALSEEKKALLARVEDLQLDIEEYREREKNLRDALMSTQKMTEQMKGTAQREAQLIIDAANAKAESLLSQAHQRMARIQEEVSGLKRLRVQFELKIKSVAESYLKLIEMGKKEYEELDVSESKVKYIRKSENS